ncbi:MAG: phytoene desaturase [Deltaproteobacteria bacterium]|nr:phytoene desaturase [Deltaproteobacteria bacterium]
MPDVIVIGSGLGGLSAAVSLAAKGLGVTVVEAAPNFGGKANIVTLDGVECDTGPSVLTLPDTLDAVLREAGTSLAAEVTLLTHTPAFRYVTAKGDVLDLMPTLPETLANVSKTLGEAAARELATFMADAAEVWELSKIAFVYGEAPSVRSLWELGPAKMAGFGRVDPFRSMWAAICNKVKHPLLRVILARYATYNGSDPRSAPATLNCIAHVEIGLGGYGVRGGVYELVRALVRVAERQGVRLRASSPVESLTVERGRAVGVTLRGGEALRASAIVCNADVAHLHEHLLPKAQRRVVAAPETPSMSGWTGLVRARRRVGQDARAAHTVLFPEDYLEEFADIFDRDRPPQAPTVYCCAQEPCHQRRGWADHEPVFIMTNAPPEPRVGARPAEVYDALRERALGRLREAGLIDQDDAVVWERAPSGLAAAYPGSRGALYGASSNSLFAAFKRPANRVSGLPGLYLASGSAHPGGGMPLCVLSGRMAARHVLADLGEQTQAAK